MDIMTDIGINPIKTVVKKILSALEAQAISKRLVNESLIGMAFSLTLCGLSNDEFTNDQIDTLIKSSLEVACKDLFELDSELKDFMNVNELGIIIDTFKDALVMLTTENNEVEDIVIEEMKKIEEKVEEKNNIESNIIIKFDGDQKND